MVIPFFALALAAASAQPVTIEIVVVGHAEAKAARFEGNVLIRGEGDSAASAQASLAERRKAVAAAIAAAGGTLAEDDGASVDMAVPLTMMDMDKSGATSAKKPVRHVTASIAYHAPDRAAATRVAAAIEKIDGASSFVAAKPVAGDQAAARRAAKLDGLAKARTEAADYVTRLGLGTATITSISEKTDIGAIVTMMEGRSSPFGPRATTGDTVTTDVPMTVTFRLDPK